MKNYILMILLCAGSITHITAQSFQFSHAVIGASGSAVTANNFIFSQQTGELSIQTKSSSSIIFTEGFEQGVKDICNGLDDDFDGQVDEDALFISWYLDADADGYWNGVPVISCSSPGTGYTSSIVGANDCDDHNASVHPGAVEICGNGIDDNCDGQTDENCCSAPGGLFTSNITSTAATLNWINVNGALRYVIKYKKLGAGPWNEVNPRAPSSSYNISGLIPSSQYKWVMRARCAYGFSPNSRVVYFSTTASSPASKNIFAETLEEGLNIYPNPAVNNFVIQLNIAENITGGAIVQVSDMNGRIVYNAQAPVVNGRLYHKVNINDNLSGGNYFIKVIAGRNAYTEKVMITR